MEKKRKGSFLGGALLGLGLGFLLAPKSGKETRKDLSNKIAELWDKVRSMDSEEIKDALSNKLKEIEDGLNDLDKEKILKVAKEKGEQLKKKAEELFERAKETGKPIIENAANAVKIELASNVRKILEKLEQE